MKHSISARIFLTLLAGASLISGSQAKDAEVPNHNLSEWKLGSLVSGEAVTTEALAGKVVVIEYWGTR